MAGRKTKYTPEIVERLTYAIGLGLAHRLACDYAGIDPSTFYDWMKTKPEFSHAVKRAEGEGAVERLKRIKVAGENGIWQADAWWLERHYPEEYGRNRVELTGSVDTKVTLKWANEEPSDD